ncbi:MAG: YebC/PmpR family DNA-binding transcriptional regulator [Opitutaceae bacterium]|nr:YebC/PmpR family DNA-binding transcriptional regulator [Opitutaceae bacterium]
MAGHNKWSKVKRIKAVTDARKGKVFSRLSRDITLAAKAGGGDPEGNARLRTLLLKAREANMPADNIDRAIKKGTGELPGVVFEEITYEGYGPAGVAFIVKVTTDNKQRAAQEVRSVFAKHGGNLAQSGAVAFQFLHAGQFLVTRAQCDEDRLMEVALEAGAEDVISSEDGFEVRCEVQQFDKVVQALERAGIKTESAEISYIPNNTVPVTDVALAGSVVKLHDLLEELEDVQAVFSNEEMSDEVSAAANG